MSKYIVTVFDDEKTAYAGAQAIRALDIEGSLAVYEGAIISKNENGVVRLKDAVEEGPIGTATGMMLGSLLGVLGGPIGMAVGATAGTIGGLLVDASNAGVNDRFLDEIAEELTPGKFAVVAEIDEGWTAPLDARMEELGAEVHRAWRVDIEDEQIDRDIEATNREYAELKDEWSQATDDAKAKLKAKMDAAGAKLEALKERATKKIEDIEKQTDAKIKKLDEQIAKASDETKQKYETARAEAKAECQRRCAKLKEAGKALAEAVA